jgi:hypothetical protein
MRWIEPKTGVSSCLLLKQGKRMKILMNIRNHAHKFFDFSIRGEITSGEFVLQERDSIPHFASSSLPFASLWASASLLLMTTFYRWTVPGAGDSSFIHLKLVFPYGLRFVRGGFFRNDMSFLCGGRGRSGDTPAEI